MDGLDDIRNHYESALERGADSGQKVGWRDTTAQVLRFQSISRILDGITFNSLCDFGCGTGDLLRFLRTQGWAGSYHGLDVSPKMVSAGTSQFRSDRLAQFEVSTSPVKADVTIASGVFNVLLRNSQEGWQEYCRESVYQMWESSSRAIVFNMLSTDSDPSRRKSELAYMDPSDWLSYCRQRLSDRVRLDQTYGQFDFTIGVFRI